MNTVQKNNNITNGSMSRKINNMPRKALGYKTPLEIFEEKRYRYKFFRYIQS